MDLVLATRNPGKVEEMRPMLAGIGYSLINQTDMRIPSAEENGATFVENALIKARSVAEATGLPCIADDSGLVVQALQGAPGIYSARYAGEGASDADNNQRLLAALAGRTDRVAFLLLHGVYALSPGSNAADCHCPVAWGDTERGSRQGRIRLRPIVLAARACAKCGRAAEEDEEPYQSSGSSL